MTRRPRIGRMSLAIAAALLLASTAAGAADPPARLRIGTFDSRLVALAYYRSAHGHDALSGLREELAKAKAENDEKRVKGLEAKEPALQNLMHQQVFGCLSIPNVLATVSDSLAVIAARAGVAMLVSKWEIRCDTSGAEQVDLTRQIVELFQPDPATRTMIEDAMKQAAEPVPVEQLLDPYE